MIDLSTTYLGLKLNNPLVVSAGPLTKEVANVLRMEDAGASAVVMHSLFEEQINLESNELDRFLSDSAESFSEALSYFPDMTSYNIGPDEYLNHLRKVKQAVAIPVIASLNGVSTGGWIHYARKIEQAGADALELNIYYLPTNSALTSGDVEQMYCDLVAAVRANVHIPLAVKLGPHFSAIPNFARRLERAGADALVLFNRFYLPDFDLETRDVTPTLTLSNSQELLLRLHWVGILYGTLKADLAITGGVHTAEDVVKSVMAGAKVAMMTSCLLRHGIGALEQIEDALTEWLEEHEYESIREMRGSMSQQAVPDPAAFERANYMKVLSSYTVRAPRN
jgi:dihydroorotate dehydrogenase (fumarate)